MRYDVELTDTIAPIPFHGSAYRHQLSAADFLAAQDALGVQQGFPRDTNNFAPRFGVAWDINNDGKTVVRAAFGLFYDHPLLAIAFNSDIADAAQQQQYTNVLAGQPGADRFFNLCRFSRERSARRRPRILSARPCRPGSPPRVSPRRRSTCPAGCVLTIRRSSGLDRCFRFTLDVAKDFSMPTPIRRT